MLIARIQGWFYLFSGAWPLLHRDSFEAVTGPKTDFWLVRTVGLLLCVSGGVMLLAARARRVTREIALLGVLQAAALLVVDLVCVFEPRTTPIYLLDAMAETALIAGWRFSWRRVAR